MLDFPRWKIWSIVLFLAFGVLSAIPSLMPERIADQIPSYIPHPRFNLGLDLSGGSHLLLEADTADVAKSRIALMDETVRTEMRRATPKIEIGDISAVDGRLSFMVRDPAQVDAAVEKVRGLTQGAGMTGQRDWNVAVIDTSRIVMTPTQSGLDAAVDARRRAARSCPIRVRQPAGSRCSVA